MNTKNINKFDHKLSHSDLIVDALFGTGLSKPASCFMETVINKINQYEKFTVSIDINSGINADSGMLIGPHVFSDLTFALASMKKSHLLHPAASVMKKVELLDIGIPNSHRTEYPSPPFGRKRYKEYFSFSAARHT